MSERKLIETAPHEFQAHLLFADHGLAPYFAGNHRTEQGDDSPSAEFVFRGNGGELRCPLGSPVWPIHG